MKTFLSVLFAVVACAGPAFAQADASRADREITHVQGDVYRVRDGRQHTIFLVTPGGILLADPLNVPTATWLKEELPKRFPASPVRYVVFTHHRFDRAEGGGVFFNDAELVGPETFNGEVSRARTTLGFLAHLDRDRSGALQREEIGGDPAAALLISKDRNGDGIVTAEELYRHVTGVTRSFNARRTIWLGEKRVDLIHVRAAHPRALTLVYVPDERIVFGTDDLRVTSSPLAFGSDKPHDIVTWLRTVSSLDFDVLLTGDGDRVSKTDLAARRDYAVALEKGVAAGYEAGHSLTRIQASPVVGAYQTTPHYAARNAQIADMYRHLRLLTADVSGTAVARHAFANVSFCGNTNTCTAGGTLPFATVGLTISRGRLGVLAETTLGNEWRSSRTGRFRDDEMVTSASRISALLRCAAPPRRFSAALLGGMSATLVHTRGTNTLKQYFPPPGPLPFSSAQTLLGVTGGVDVTARVSKDVRLVLPVRATRSFGDRNTRTWAPPENGVPMRRLDVQAGVGVAIRILRRIS